MEKAKSCMAAFLVSAEYCQAVLALDDKTAGQLFKAVYAYHCCEDELERITSESPVAAAMLNMMRPRFDENAAKYAASAEKNRANGKHGGRPRKNGNPEKPTGFSENRNEPNETQSNQYESKYEYKKEIEIEKKDTPPTPSRRGRRSAPAEDSEFDEFWAVYPKREAKAQAQAAFARAKSSKEWPGITAVIKAVTSQSNAKGWNTNKQYCPLASTWLNNSRWQDEVSAQGYSATKEDSLTDYYKAQYKRLFGKSDLSQDTNQEMDNEGYYDVEYGSEPEEGESSPRAIDGIWN